MSSSPLLPLPPLPTPGSRHDLPLPAGSADALQLAEIASRLGGRRLLVAIIENAARPEMRVLRGPLAGLGDLVRNQRVKSPALIVIGEVAARESAAREVLALMGSNA